MRLEERVEALERKVTELAKEVEYQRGIIRPYETKRIREEVRSAQALIEILNLPTGKK